jgi:cell division protein ZapA (FtsZ GTPase activity inhibitor)
MWVVEINILGRRFTLQVDDRREALKVHSRAVQSRLSQLRRPRAAA